MAASRIAKNLVGGIATLPPAATTDSSRFENRVGGCVTLPTAATTDSRSAKRPVGGIATFSENAPEDGRKKKKRFVTTDSIDSVTSGSGEWGLFGGTARGSILPGKEAPRHEPIPSRNQWTNREVLGRADSASGEFPLFRGEWAKDGKLNDPDGAPRQGPEERVVDQIASGGACCVRPLPVRCFRNMESM